MAQENYFENTENNFWNQETYKKAFGHVIVTLDNCPIDNDVSLEVGIIKTEEDYKEVKEYVSPQEAYWLGKCLIDYAQNAERLRRIYAENRAKELEKDA